MEKFFLKTRDFCVQQNIFGKKIFLPITLVVGGFSLVFILFCDRRLFIGLFIYFVCLNYPPPPPNFQKKGMLRVESVTPHIIWQKNHKTTILRFEQIKLLVNLRNLNETLHIYSLGLRLSNNILLITFNNKVLLKR